jgi:branched-chain amino acid transport system ATP-binding protein
LAPLAENQNAAKPMLEVVGLTKHFGGLQALDQVSFDIHQNRIISLIGPNGAGKTTFINVVTGVFASDSGHVRFQGENIAGLLAHQIAHAGIARTFQLEELFSSLTVLENAMVGCHAQRRCGLFNLGLGLPAARREEERLRDEALENLKLVGLQNKAGHAVTSLPLGERKSLGIARALGSRPKLLMLDEPAGGMAAHETARLTDLVYQLRDRGLGVLIVEHNMPFVMSISEKVIVLEYGSKIAEGVPGAIMADSRVIKAYLGEEG